MTPSVGSLLARVAAEGLPQRDEQVEVVLDDATFAALLDIATSERITGHLERALDAGWLVGSDAQRELAQRRHEEMLALDLVLERLLVETSRTLTNARLDHRALKGPVVARTAYADPSLRSFGDVDILVAADRFDDAVGILEAEGGRARYRQPRPNFTARFGKGVCVATAQGLEIDVHRVFVAGPFGLAIDADDLFAGRESITIGDAAVPVLPAPERFLHACYHAGLTSPRITAVRDVAQMAGADDLDMARSLALATRWRGRAVVQRALRVTRARLHADLRGPWYEWADHYVPDRFERVALRPYTGTTRSHAAQMATGIWALRGVRARIEYGFALLVPNRSYLREREGNYVRRWRHGLSLARRSKGAR